MYMAAANRYRRQHITFSTELEGLVPSPGDLVAIQHDLPAWGQGGDVLAMEGAVIELSEPVTFEEAGNHYIAFRKRDGSISGPWRVEATGDPHRVALAEAIADGFQPSLSGRERTQYTFGPSGQFHRLARVLPSIRPRGGTVELTCVVENPAVHSADSGIAPAPDSGWGLPSDEGLPTIGDLRISAGGTAENPFLEISWRPARNASFYLVQMSEDGEDWRPVGETSRPRYALGVRFGTIRVRVAAMGSGLGPWLVSNPFDARTFFPPPPSVGNLRLLEPWKGRVLRVTWDEAPRAIGYDVQFSTGTPATILRSMRVRDRYASYDADQIKADGGPYRDMVISVSAVGPGASSGWATLSAANTPPATPSVSIMPMTEAIAWSTGPCDDGDWAGTLVAYSTGSFSAGQGTILDFGQTLRGAIPNLAAGTTYFFRVAHYDSFGKVGLNWSSLIQAVPLQPATGIDVVASLPPTGDYEGHVVYNTATEKLHRWDGGAWVTWIDGSDILASSITAGKLSVLTLSSISANMGSLAAGNITIENSDNGYIRGGATNSAIGTGFFLGREGSEWVFRAGDPNGSHIMTRNGQVTIAGDLGVVGGGNLIYNSDGIGGVAGVTWSDDAPLGHVFGLNNAGYHVPGRVSWFLHQPNALSGGGGAILFGGGFNVGASEHFMPVIGGQHYEMSAYTGALRCHVYLQVVWYDASFNYIAYENSAQVNDAEGTGGPTLDHYKRLFARVKAPAGARFAKMQVAKSATKPGQPDSWMFVMWPMFALCSPLKTTPSPWSPGGYAGGIPGQIIAPGSIPAGRLAANSIVANDGVIANAAVGTLQLAGQAVTIPNSTYAEGAVAVGGGWSDVLVLNVNSSGAPIYVHGSFYAYLGSIPNAIPTAFFRMVRDKALPTERIFPQIAADGSFYQFFDWRGRINQGFSQGVSDTPGAGARTYTLQATATVGLYISSRFLVAIETKR